MVPLLPVPVGVGVRRDAKDTPTPPQYGDTTHTLVERGSYSGLFLPGFKKPISAENKLLATLPSIGLRFIDHVVGNQPDLQMNNVADWYQKQLTFHRYASLPASSSELCVSNCRSTDRIM